MSNFKENFDYKKSIIERYIKDDFKDNNSSYKTVIDAMNYSVSVGGKRIRPILMLSAYEIFNNNINNVLPFCAAIEYIHTYSLIHDDLPAMDDDCLRRGNPTCHIKYGEAIAILAGDALLNLAFEKMINSDADNQKEAMKVISSSSGYRGMIGGQVIDIENEGKKIPLELLNELHALKTGALIKSSCVTGAILGGGSKKDIELFDEFGSLIGLAFQIKDDILDKTSTKEVLGKSIGKDEQNEKTTYLTHFSIEECQNIVNDLTIRANEILSYYGEKGEFLKELANYLLNRNS